MSRLGDLYYGTKNYLHNRRTARDIRRIVNAFISFSKDHTDPEFQKAHDYYVNGGQSPFPYKPSVDFSSPEVHNDGYPYIMHNAKKLYFPKNYDPKTIIRTYKGMVLEQDKTCPHCYTQNDFEVPIGCTLVDLGCAEAMFSLDHVETVSKLYLLETKPEWIKALQRTFKPWKEKVEIIHKYASDKNGPNETCLNELFKEEKDRNFYIKMDIEGYEGKVLDGAEQFLQSANHIQLAIATYHNQHDFTQFEQQLKQLGYSVDHTEGYILFFYDKTIQEPFLRRCILQATNTN